MVNFVKCEECGNTFIANNEIEVCGECIEKRKKEGVEFLAEFLDKEETS